MRKTKIICTLGPAVDTDCMVRELILSGMDCARLNFSHGTHEEQKVRMDRVKRIRQELGKYTPILLDTKGPEIRLKDFKDGSVMVEKGKEIVLRADSTIIGDETQIGLTFPYLADNVKEGNTILVDDGKVNMTVVRIDGPDVVCCINNDGKLSNHKSINIPGVIIDMPYINDVDKSDILFGIEQDVDYIAASFVRTADDVRQLRQLLDENGGENIKIISKIENQSGINNLDEIILLSDGIMVARGDMGVEVPFIKLPSIQKEMIKKCRDAGKIVITATQMLESMTTNIRPTRAEVSDVANSIYDGTTVIMLSGESAAGRYPIESVKTMANIAVETENTIDYHKRFTVSGADNVCENFPDAIAFAAAAAAHGMDAKAIVCMSKTGLTVSMLARYDMSAPIIAAVCDEKAVRQLNLVGNVIPYHVNEVADTDKLFGLGIDMAKKSGMVKSQDVIVITGSAAVGDPGTDVMKLHRME